MIPTIGRAKMAVVDRFIKVLQMTMPTRCEEITAREKTYLPAPTAYYYVRSEEQIKSFPVVDEVACFIVVKSSRQVDARTSSVAGRRGELGGISVGVVLTFLHAGDTAARWGRYLTQQETTLLRTELYSEALIETLYTHAIGKDGAIDMLDLTREDNAIDLATEESPESGTVTTEWLVRQQVSIPTDKFEV